MFTLVREIVNEPVVHVAGLVPLSYVLWTNGTVVHGNLVLQRPEEFTTKY